MALEEGGRKRGGKRGDGGVGIVGRRSLVVFRIFEGRFLELVGNMRA